MASKVVVFTTLLGCCWCYNIETSGRYIKYIQSPILSIGVERVPDSGPVFPEITPSYFGYDFQLRPGPGQTFSVIAGAPKTSDARRLSSQDGSNSLSTTGDVLTCRSGFPPPSPLCSSIVPQPVSPGDNYGLNVEVGRDSTLHACSPTKEQSCPPVQYSPGFCYRRRRNRAEWEADPRTQELACPPINLDLIFLLDGSESVGPVNFETVKDWTVNVSRSFDIRDGSTRIGVVQYSHLDVDRNGRPLARQRNIVTEIELGAQNNFNDFTRAVEGIKLQAFTTYTAHALNKTVDDFESSPRFGDSSTAKVLILLTDGKSDDQAYLADSANYVRSLGITTFSVGVGDININELRTVATGTDTDERVYFANDFDGLNEVAGKLRAAILSFVLEGTIATGGGPSYQLEVAETGISIHASRTVNYINFGWKIRCTIVCVGANVGCMFVVVCLYVHVLSCTRKLETSQFSSDYVQIAKHFGNLSIYETRT
ncbi:integrin alpha-M-like [Clavelina lepadiformis]|uniref:integrin alpha-M-like n=1 Tax=Clavelina lepadiformis TaxID=159417 RepID=UPI004042D161